MQLGGKVITMSDSTGFIHDPDGLTEEKLEYIIKLKTFRRRNLSEFAENFNCKFYEDKKPWSIKADLAFPCATQNEIDKKDAKILIKNGCIGIAEGANMPSNKEAVEAFREAGIVFGPSKAANAGGVAVSGLEMTQNSIRMAWHRDELEERLKKIMQNIHQQCINYGVEKDRIDYLKGANLAGFVKVANAMLAYGVL